MIIFFHSLYIVIKPFIINQFKSNKWLKKFITFTDNNLKIVENDDAEGKQFKFDPPLYKQRYGEIQKILLDNKWKNEIETVADFGCAEMKLFSFLKHLFRIKKILEVDIDEDLLMNNLFRVRPLLADYISRRTEKLKIQILCGSISDPDKSLLAVDCVIGVEIIEHLYPDTLDALPYNLFGYIQPKLVVFTTPNADYNIIFPHFKGFRHHDHKFEWSRNQFELWAQNIVDRFPNYSVSFRGIGDGPKGFEHVGYCSQMAIFVREHLSEISCHKHELDYNCSCRECVPLQSFGICKYFSYTEMHKNSLKLPYNENNFYKLIETIEYPYDEDSRSPQQKILDELKYKIDIFYNLKRFRLKEQNRVEIPLINIIFNVHTHFTTIEEASDILKQAGYTVEKCMINNELTDCVVREIDMESHNSHSPISNIDDSSEDDEDYHTEWTPFIDKEESEWEIDADIQKTPWIIDFEDNAVRVEALTNASEVISNIVNNLSLPNIITENRGHMSNNLDNGCDSNSMYDSGYYKSNTNLTSPQSCSDVLDSDILDEQFTNIRNTTINNSDNAKIVHLNTTSEEIITVYEIDKHFDENITDSDMERVGISKSYKSKVNAQEILPNTSNVEKLKKEIDEEVIPAINEINDVVNEQHNVEIIPNILEVIQLPNQVVENGDLANNNRDLEGNNYPNANRNNEHNNGGNDNEHFIFQNNIDVNFENDINEDVQNRNADLEDDDVVVERLVDDEENDANKELELEGASQEVLFDPNSEADDLSNDVEFAQNAIEIPQQNIIFFGIGPASENYEIGSVLPVVADQFPNWLLHLLSLNIPEDEENHDEPHFYCQGDGVGVHPSFMEEDYEDETSSSNSSYGSGSLTSSHSNEEAEAEPTVSELEVGSLSDDVNDGSMMQNSEQDIANVRQIIEPLIGHSVSISTDSETADDCYDTAEEILSLNSTLSEKDRNTKNNKKDT